MSPATARQLVADSVLVGSSTLAYSLNGLAHGDALDPAEYDESQAELERLVGEGQAPVELLQAFRVVAANNQQQYTDALRRFRREVAERGATAVGNDAQDAFDNGAVFGAYMDACDELAVRPAAAVAARPREARSRARRSRTAATDDDDGLADLPRRCPRCGGALRPLLPSPHWRCDPCADELWERIVSHEAERVLAEADWLTWWSA